VRPANIELHIEELVLHGFAPGDRYRIGKAVEHELQRLFAEQGAPPAPVDNTESWRVDGGSFNIAPGAPPEAVGAQVAQALHGGLSR